VRNHLNSQTPLERTATPVCQEKATEQPDRRRLIAKRMNHHCRGRRSRNKYCKDKHPRGNHKKSS
jgi:hypothetical protein